MADFGAPVAQNVYVSPQKGLQTLSSLISLKQQQQQLQTGQYVQASAQAEAQKNQQLMGERQRIQQMMQSGQDDQGNSIYGADGKTPDSAKVIPALGRI